MNHRPHPANRPGLRQARADSIRIGFIASGIIVLIPPTLAAWTRRSRTGQEQVKKRLGARLRQLRKAQKLSQEEVALRAGLDRSYFGAIERGEKNLSLVNIHRIADALEVGAGELFEE